MPDASLFTSIRNSSAIVAAGLSNGGLPKHNISGSVTSSLKQVGKSLPTSTVTIGSFGPLPSVSFKIENSSFSSLNNEQLKRLSDEYANILGLNPSNINLSLTEGSIVVNFNYLSGTNVQTLSPDEIGIINNLATKFSDGAATLNEFKNAINNANLNAYFVIDAATATSVTINVSPALLNTINNRGNGVDPTTVVFSRSGKMYGFSEKNLLEIDVRSGKCVKVFDDIPEPVYSSQYSSRVFHVIGISYDDKYLTFADNIWSLANYDASIGLSEAPIGQRSVHRVNLLTGERQFVDVFSEQKSITEQIFYNPFTDTLYDSVPSPGYDDLDSYRFTGLTTYVKAISTEKFYKQVPLTKQIFVKRDAMLFVEDKVVIKRVDLVSGVVTTLIGIPQVPLPNNDSRVTYNYDITSGPIQFAGLAPLSPVRHFSEHTNTLQVLDEFTGVLILINGVSSGTPITIEKVYGTPQPKDAQGYILATRYAAPNAKNVGRIDDGINWTIPVMHHMDRYKTQSFIINGFGVLGTITRPSDYWKLYTLYKLDGVFSKFLALFNTTPRDTDFIFELSSNGLYYICTGHILGTNATGDMIIPPTYKDKPVEEIGPNAFKDYIGITSLSLPNSIKVIGVRAFENCKGLRETLTLPSSLQTIQSYAFYGCVKIEGDITIPNSVTSIGEYAFYRVRADVNTQAPKNIFLPPGLQSIGKWAFAYTNFAEITISEGITNIPESCFESSKLIERIVFPNSLTTLGKRAFANCEQYTGRFNIPPLVTRIPDECFTGCGLAVGPLTIPNNVTSIGNNAFANAFEMPQLVTNVPREPLRLTLSNNLTSIGEGAFLNCKITEHLIIPETLTTIPANVFKNTRITMLTLPYTIQTIGESAFGEISSLIQTIYISPSVNLHVRAFFISNFVTIIRGVPPLPPSPPGSANRLIISLETGNYYTVIGIRDPNVVGPLYIPTLASDGLPIKIVGQIAITLTESQRNNITGIIIEEGIVEIYGGAFSYGFNSVQEIRLPSSLETIGNGAFASTNGVRTITFANNSRLHYISSGAFSGCGSLAGIQHELVIPDGPYSYIGNNAFGYMKLNAGLKFTNSFKYTNPYEKYGINHVFHGSGVLSDHIGVPTPPFNGNDLITTGIGMFIGCNITGNVNLGSIGLITEDTFEQAVFNNNPTIIGPNLKRIGGGALFNFTGKFTFNTPVLEIIGPSCFFSWPINNQPDLELTIPNTVHTIGEKAFYGLRFKNIILPNALTRIQERLFDYLDLTVNQDLVIPNSVTEIASDAFSGINKVKSINIPANIKAIRSGSYAKRGSTVDWPINSPVLPSTLQFLGPDGVSNPANILLNGSVPALTTISRVNLPSSWVALRRFPTATIEKSGGYCYFLLDSSNTYMVTGFDWDSISSPPTTLIIPATFNGKPVTHVKDYAFADIERPYGDITPRSPVRDITSIILSNNLTNIGNSAFEGFYKLDGVITIPDSVTTIGDRAFWYEQLGYDNVQRYKPMNLEFIVGSGVTSMGGDAFDKRMHNIQFKPGCKAIGANLFSGCFNLKSRQITIPSSVTTIGTLAFDRMDILTPGPLQLTNVGEIAFTRCRFTDLKLGGLTGINNDIFYKCTFSGTVTLPPALTFIGDRTFYEGTQVNSTALTIPNTVTIIGDEAFSYFQFTGPLVLPSALTSIGYAAFRYCHRISGSLTIPNNVTRIGYEAFSGCTGLTGTLIIPSSVTYIGGSAFRNCSGITSIVIEGTPRINFHAFKGCTLAAGSYTTTGTTLVDSNAFEGCPLFTVNR
jgi:hypothetical protein